MEKTEKMTKTFDEWFGEHGNYYYRFEQFYDDVDFSAKTHDYDLMVGWLKTAYEMGYKEGMNGL